MCGIVGFITEEAGKLAVDRQQFMRDGLIIDTLRGADATGAFMVPHAWHKEVEDEDKIAFCVKKAVPGYEFVTSGDYSKEMYPIRDWRAVVGHNRAATRGRRDDANAHPFQEGPITLVHNGTLTTTYGLPKDMYDLNKTRKKADEITVDSHVVCHNLGLVEPHEASSIIEALRGAFVLVWNDARDESVNIVRNSQRPLHMAYGKDEKTLYFLSESELLYALCKRTRINIGNIFYPKPGVWMKWRPDTPVHEPIIKEVDLTKAYKTNSFRYEDDESQWNGYTYGSYNTWKPPVTQTPTAQPANKEVTLPGKMPAASAEESKVTILGRRREIPIAHQENLYLYGLLVEDRLPFLPHQPEFPLVTNPKPGLFTTAEGCLYGGDAGRYSAVVYNTPQGAYSRSLITKINERLMWTVRPVAVKWLRQTNGVEKPLIICHFVNNFYLDALARARDNAVTTLPELDKPPGKQGAWPGPRGTELTDAEFADLCQNGCAVCNMPIIPRDADQLEWVDAYPICPDCQDPEDMLAYDDDEEVAV